MWLGERKDEPGWERYITGLCFEMQTSFACGKAFGLKTDILLTHSKFTPRDAKGKIKD